MIVKHLYDVIVEGPKKARTLQVRGRDRQEAAAKVRRGHRRVVNVKGRQVTSDTIGIVGIDRAL